MKQFKAWPYVTALFAVLCLLGAIMYWSDWASVKPWMDKPLKDATVGDAFVFLVICFVFLRDR